MKSETLLRCGSFSPLSAISTVKHYDPFRDKPKIANRPKRKSLEAIPDNGLFVLPINQCFLRNPRLGNGTKIMLALLAGWNGAGGQLKTTTGTIAQQLGKCRRTIFSYLKDAMEEGYLTYSKLKSRDGYYIGIKIFLNTPAIRKMGVSKPAEKKEITKKMAQIRDVQDSAEINKNILIKKKKDDELLASLAKLALKLGFIDNPEIRTTE